MGWCDDPISKKYNKLVFIPFGYSHEKLFRKDNIYDAILVLDYNMRPIKKNKGSAIFIHISKGNYKSTNGCVGIKKLNIIKIAAKHSNIIGADINELSPIKGFNSYNFLVAKLAYKIISYTFEFSKKFKY